jgi:hypothetical protein
MERLEGDLPGVLYSTRDGFKYQATMCMLKKIFKQQERIAAFN